MHFHKWHFCGNECFKHSSSAPMSVRCPFGLAWGGGVDWDEGDDVRWGDACDIIRTSWSNMFKYVDHLIWSLWDLSRGLIDILDSAIKLDVHLCNLGGLSVCSSWDVMLKACRANASLARSVMTGCTPACYIQHNYQNTLSLKLVIEKI